MKTILKVSFLLLTFIFAEPWVDPNVAKLNTVQCNNIYPFSFVAETFLSPTAIIHDWDLQDFTNFNAFTSFSSTTARNYQVGAKSSYVAILFEDSLGLQVGVTYETERAFKWLKIITNAKPGGQSTLKVASFQSVLLTTVTTSVREGINDSIITVAYESTDSNLIYIVSLKYLSGNVLSAYAINAGTSSSVHATSVSSQVVWQSALYNTAQTTETAIHFVFGLSDSDAIEIHYSLTNPTLPVLNNFFKYKTVMNLRPNVNQNFTKVLGISSNSIQAFNSSVGQNLIWNTQSLNTTISSFDYGCQCSGTQLWPIYPSSDCGSPFPSNCHTRIIDYSWDFSQTFMNAQQLNVGGTKSWYYSATAFLAQNTATSQTIYWYVSQLGQDGTNKQELREYSYTFSTSSNLTSYAVSHDAPGLCMTAAGSTGANTNVYLDDFRITGEIEVFNSNTTQSLCGGSCVLYYPYYYFGSIPNYLKWQIGLKTFKVDQTVACRAQNTQIDQLHYYYGQAVNQVSWQAICMVSTSILLESTNNQRVHLLQLTYPRTKSVNYAILNQLNGVWAPNNFDCSQIVGPGTSSTLTYQQYSYQLPETNFIGFLKAYLNFGFTFSPTTGPTRIAPSQGFYFYLAGIQTTDQSYITIETNNQFMRQTSIVIDSTIDLIITDTDFTQQNSLFPIQVSSYGDILGVSLYSAGTISSTVLANIATNPPGLAQYFSMGSSEVLALLKDQEKWNDKYNWQYTTQPQILFQDIRVKNSLMCIEIRSLAFSQNIFINNVSNILMNGTSYYSMDYNLWPYTNCIDRQLYPPATQTSTLKFTDYFIGLIKSPSLNQVQTYSQINFTVDLTTGTMSFPLSPNPGIYGLQNNAQNFQFAIGRDSFNQSWYQQMIILDQCDSKNFIWQVSQDERSFPLNIGVLFGANTTNLTLPSVIISTKTMNTPMSDTKSYLGDLQYSVYYQSDTNSSQITLFNSSQVQAKNGQIYFQFPSGQLNINYTCIIYVYMKQPYYYLDQKTFQYTQSYINLTTNPQQLLNVQVFNNLPPQFILPLKNQQVAVGDTINYTLPQIIDPDSGFGQIYSFNSVPKLNFGYLMNSNGVSGNQFVFSPKEIKDVGTYQIYIGLQDRGVVKATSISVFNLKVFLNIQSDYAPPSQEKVYQSSDEYSIRISQINSKAEVYLIFSKQTSLLVNPNVVANTTVLEYLQYCLYLQHSQLDRFTQKIIQLDTPTFTVKQFDGQLLQIVLKFTDKELLSKSLLQKIDYVNFIFNDTKVFVSEDGLYVPSQTVWKIYKDLPIMEASQDSITQAINKTTSIGTNSFQGILTANFILNIILSTSMQTLWGTINIMQLVLHTPLLNIVLPDTSYELCNSLIQVTSFQVINTDQITAKIFESWTFSNDSMQPLSDRFSQSGYSYKNFIYNMGMLLYILVGCIGFAVVYILMKLLNVVYPTSLTLKLEKFSLSQFKISWFLRYYIEGQFVFLICAQLQLYVFYSISSWIDIFSNILALAFLTLTLVMPVLFFFKLRKCFIDKSLQNEHIIKYLGELYEAQLHINPFLSQVMYNVALMVRRIIVSSCFFYMSKVAALQIGIQLFMCAYWTGYILAERPFEDPALNILECMNNVIYWLTLVVCFGMTSFNNQMENTFVVLGWVYNSLILGMILFNSCFMILQMAHRLILILKRVYNSVQRWKNLKPPQKSKTIAVEFGEKFAESQIRLQMECSQLNYWEIVYQNVQPCLYSKIGMPMVDYVSKNQVSLERCEDSYSIKPDPLDNCEKRSRSEIENKEFSNAGYRGKHCFLYYIYI